MQARLPRRVQLAVQRLADQGVREIIALRALGRSHQLRTQRLIDGVQRRRLIEARNLRGNIEVERTAKCRPDGQQGAGLSGEPPHASREHLADAVRNADRLDRGGGGRIARTARQAALFDQVLQDLADKERIAVRCRADRGRQRVPHVGRRLAVGNQLRHLVLVEPLQRDALAGRLAVQRAERIGQRMLRVELDVAIGAEQEQTMLRGEARHVAQHGDRALVGPVQIVEHQHDRRARRGGDQELADGVEQAEALFVGLQTAPARARRAAARAPPGPRARSARRRSRDRRAACRLGTGVRRRRSPRRRVRTAAPIRPRSSRPTAPARRARRAWSRELRRRARLADARLADQQHEAPTPVQCAVQGCAQRSQLGCAADEEAVARLAQRLLHRFGAPDPAGHAEGAELRQRGVEQWSRHALAIAGLAAARVHQRLVVVDDRAQRPGALLVEHRARLREPLDGLVVTTLQRAEPRQGEPAIHHGMMDVERDDLLTQVRLDDLDVIDACQSARGSRRRRMQS